MQNAAEYAEGLSEIEALVSAYYTEYYKVSLGLPDWADRVALRLREEETYCRRFIEWIEIWFSYRFVGKRVLVCGCGTGGELVNFWDRGAKVFGIDSNKAAVAISKKKARLNCQNEITIEEGCLEKIHFESNSFDFVYCASVLEHVNNVEEALSEIIRCTKPSGRIFIECPDYRQWYEPHYKLPLPMFLPRALNRVLLMIARRPIRFLGSLNLVDSKKLANMIMNHPVTAFRVIHPWPSHWQNPSKWQFRIIKLITRYLEIHRDQFWLLQKREHRP
jgi:2-polyprenyl-3-methyl-5-hydroxy-6-metoxy-1,4-benzoquinol methylase